MPAGAIGLVHSHPSMLTDVTPPSRGFGDNDYDDASLKATPIQLVVESDSGRLWGQFAGGYTILIGRLGDAWVRVAADDDAFATIAFKTVSMEVLQEQQRENDRLLGQQQRDALLRKAAHPGNR
jgi:hypothetical protein